MRLTLLIVSLTLSALIIEAYKSVKSVKRFFSRKLTVPSASPSDETTFADQGSYIKYLESVAALPRGFRVGATQFQFNPIEVDKTLPMNLTLIMTEEPTASFAAMFTSNKFPGGPIYVGKDRMKNSEMVQAIVVNNKISNVCPGGSSDFGKSDSEELCQAVAEHLSLPNGASAVIPSSTGIIGWKLPVDQIKNAIPAAAKSLQSESILPAALGITTTDRYPKIRRHDADTWSVCAIAKGAGMIEPNMATMLAYVLTDLDLSRDELQDCLQKATTKSFNRITIDGDQSTSDTVVLLSSRKITATPEDKKLFESKLTTVCEQLSEDMVRNGEGTLHVMKIEVKNAPSDIFARDLGRFVANSNLVKCAIAGSDPNVGRIIGAIGSFLGNYHPDVDFTEKLTLSMGGINIFKDGAFALDPEKEETLSDYMYNAQLFDSSVPEHDRNYPPHFRNVDICIDLGDAGSGFCEVIGSDLTKEYVEVNADYRS